MNRTVFYSRFFIAAFFFIGLSYWAFIFYFVPRGFSLTDDAFYLLHTRYYEEVKTLTHFGLLNRPFYYLVGESAANLRLFGASFVFLLSLTLSIVTLNHLPRLITFDNDSAIFGLSKENRLLVCLVITGGAGLYYARWLTTPSYNWWALIALMGIWQGLLLWLDHDKSLHSIVGGALLGFSGALLFWAKPTSAALVVIICLLALSFYATAFRALWKGLLTGFLGLSIGLLLPLFAGRTFSVLYEDMLLTSRLRVVLFSMADEAQYEFLVDFFYKSWQLIAGALQYYMLPRHISFLLPWFGPLAFGILTISILYFCLLTVNSPHKITLVRLVFCVGWLLSFSFLSIRSRFAFGQIGFWAISVIMLTMLYLMIAWVIHNKIQNIHNKTSSSVPSAKLILWGFVALLFPFVHAIGTSNHYSFSTAWAAIFYLIAILLFIELFPPFVRPLLFPLISGALICAMVVFVIKGGSTPYRQKGAIWNMNTVVSLRFGHEEVKTDLKTATYLKTMQQNAYENGFIEGTPVIDLSGKNPGLTYAIGGTASVAPWLLGGHPGSNEFADLVLSYWSQDDLKRAWIITSTKGRRTLDPRLLLTRDLEFPKGYDAVGTANDPFENVADTLWKPKGD